MWTKCLTTVELCLIFLATACTRHVAVSSPRVPAPASPPPAVTALTAANRAFEAKEYDDATRSYEDYLRLTPTKDQQEQVLFRLGMAYTLKKTGADWAHAQAIWRRLISEYPDSNLKPPVELILALYSELSQVNADMKVRDERIRQLSNELDRLKQIDAERRKTP